MKLVGQSTAHSSRFLWNSPSLPPPHVCAVLPGFGYSSAKGLDGDNRKGKQVRLLILI